ncbi:MAG: 23S rRNA (adenine(2503)-C(2))-methyltransferase RlmN, partial [Cyanobacteria bacterium J06621_15]
RGFQSHVNLIPYNPIQEVDYKRPSYDRIQNFTQALEKHHTAHSVRYSRGLETDAACGQLRANKKRVMSNE